MTERKTMNGTGRIENKFRPGIYVNGHYINPKYLLSATTEENLKPGFFDKTYDIMETADPE
jgi:hypothetical protein